MCQLFRSVDVDFRQIFDGSWTEVPSPSLTINEVPSTIRNEPHEAKNKFFKPQGGQMYLILKKKIFIFLVE
jgi:hypothetical protein